MNVKLSAIALILFGTSFLFSAPLYNCEKMAEKCKEEKSTLTPIIPVFPIAPTAESAQGAIKSVADATTSANKLFSQKEGKKAEKCSFHGVEMSLNAGHLQNHSRLGNSSKTLNSGFVGLSLDLHRSYKNGFYIGTGIEGHYHVINVKKSIFYNPKWSIEMPLRIGFNANNILFHLTGGSAYTKTKALYNHKNKFNFFYGLGGAVKVTNDVSASLEWRHYLPVSLKENGRKAKLEMDKLMLKISYHF